MRRRLVVDVSLRVHRLREQILAASQFDPRVLRLCGRSLDLELRFADLCFALLDRALQSFNLFDKGLDDVAHVVEMSTCQIHVRLECAWVDFE